MPENSRPNIFRWYVNYIPMEALFRHSEMSPLGHDFHMIIACSTFSVSRILEMYPLDNPLNYPLGHHFHMIIACSTFSVSTNSEMTPLNYLFHEST